MKLTIHPKAGFDADMVRKVINFCRPSDTYGFDFEVTPYKRSYQGCYAHGRGFHRQPTITVRIGEASHFPKSCKYPGFKTSPTIHCGNRLEALVMVIAHELQHHWQSRQKSRNDYYYGAKGRFSEVDADCYALSKLRAWRRVQVVQS